MWVKVHLHGRTHTLVLPPGLSLALSGRSLACRQLRGWGWGWVVRGWLSEEWGVRLAAGKEKAFCALMSRGQQDPYVLQASRLLLPSGVPMGGAQWGPPLGGFGAGTTQQLTSSLIRAESHTQQPTKSCASSA